MWIVQDGVLKSSVVLSVTCIVQKEHEGNVSVNYKSTGFVADSSRTWLRGFLGEPL